MKLVPRFKIAVVCIALLPTTLLFQNCSGGSGSAATAQAPMETAPLVSFAQTSVVVAEGTSSQIEVGIKNIASESLKFVSTCYFLELTQAPSSVSTNFIVFKYSYLENDQIEKSQICDVKVLNNLTSKELGSLEVHTVDNDVISILPIETSNFTVLEGDNHGYQYKFRLSHQPSENIVISASAVLPYEYQHNIHLRVEPATLEINRMQWAQEQLLNIYYDDDNLDTALQSANLHLSTSGEVQEVDTSFGLRDNDVFSVFLCTENGQSIPKAEVKEGFGSTKIFVCSSAVSEKNIYPVLSSSNSRLQIYTSQISFNSVTKNQIVSFDVNVPEDSIAQGPENATISVNVDGQVTGLPFSLVDNEVPKLVSNIYAPVFNISEQDVGVVYDLGRFSLSHKPVSEVKLRYEVIDTENIRFSNNSKFIDLTFNSENYSIPQRLSLVSLRPNNKINDGDESFRVKQVVLTTNSGYSELSDTYYPGLISDDDLVYLSSNVYLGTSWTPTYSQSQQLWVDDQSKSLNLRLALGSQPKAAVKVTVSSTNSALLEISPNEVTLDSSNFADGVQVNVKAKTLNPITGTQAVSIRFQTESTDSAYNALPLSTSSFEIYVVQSAASCDIAAVGSAALGISVNGNLKACRSGVANNVTFPANCSAGKENIFNIFGKKCTLETTTQTYSFGPDYTVVARMPIYRSSNYTSLSAYVQVAQLPKFCELRYGSGSSYVAKVQARGAIQAYYMGSYWQVAGSYDSSGRFIYASDLIALSFDCLTTSQRYYWAN